MTESTTTEVTTKHFIEEIRDDIHYYGNWQYSPKYYPNPYPDDLIIQKTRKVSENGIVIGSLKLYSSINPAVHKEPTFKIEFEKSDGTVWKITETNAFLFHSIFMLAKLVHAKFNIDGRVGQFEKNTINCEKHLSIEMASEDGEFTSTIVMRFEKQFLNFEFPNILFTELCNLKEFT